ncbi:hypothetical protein ABMA27_008224 [Loxostege sticticalis]|uniref:ATP-dependent DNA helicase n=1 Tax=Loxostege sticticalis TaxID=481309 RepID=A0ABR3HEC9_LOXSC
MRVRNKPAVLRTRYYTLNSDKDGYYYSLIVCHIPFRDENQLMLEDETPESCFLRRKDELRPLLTNVSSEDFAHAEQVIQQALAQATALNVARETRCENVTRETGFENIRDDQIINADEHIYQYQDDYCEDVEERGAMTDDIFLNNIRGLNIQQKNLFQRISTAIEKDLHGDDEKLLLFITGGAGSGKSFVLKLLVEQIKRCYAPTVDLLLKPKFVEVGSLTGVAARQVLGKTLHSLFSLPIEKGNSTAYRRLTGEKLEQERRKWRNISWLVIDEVSMVSYENLRMIHLRLQEFKNNDKLFGGINIVLFGDIMQLPPVKGHWCFVQPPWNAAEVNLWHAFSFCELTINMRQRNDTEFVDLLNNLRVGELTTSQLELLCQRRRVALDEEFKDGVVVRIFPTVKQVDEYNNEMTAMNSKQNRVYTIRSIDESREVATYGKRPPDNVIPKDVNNCGGLLSEVKLPVESRVMLRRNISVSDGLVNGAMGIVKTIKWPSLRRDQLEEGELPDCILVKFDDESIGNRLKDSDGCVAIPPVVATFQGTKGYGDIERRMLPIILCWAVTVHKLQGTTLDKAVIDLGKKVFAKGQAYVALSRVKTLEGIALSDLEPNKVLHKPHDGRALAEMQRLRGLHTRD